MRTIDIHSHLLNPNVQFNRLYDKITIHFFAKKLGVDPAQLQATPYTTYVTAMAQNTAQSQYLDSACLFGVDSRLNERGEETDRDNTVCAMTHDVIKVAAEYPGLFIPFMSINPRRPNALDLIDKYASQGCQGAKFLQNYWGVDLNDEGFIPYYEKLKHYRLPLIIHIGSEYSISSDTRYESVNMLKLPLETGVTVIAAHMGLGRINHKICFWRNLSKNPKYFDKDYFTLLEMLKHYNNLYADISATLVPLRARALRHLSQQTEIHHKLLFGTDYPVPYMLRFNTHDLSSDKSRSIDQIANPFDRYAKAMLAYFPEENPLYTNYKKILINH